MLCITDSVKVSRSGEHYTLFCANNGATTLLNESASLVWEGVAACLSPERIACRLTRQYDTSSSQAPADIRRRGHHVP